jgi:formiminoglutamase
MTHFLQFTQTNFKELVKIRIRETKLGEIIDVPKGETLSIFLKNSKAKFVLFGIAEDIGVLANYGNAGTANTWQSFLPSFLNIQANEFTQCNLSVIGHLSFYGLKENIEKTSINEETRIQEYRNAVSILDDAVCEVEANFCTSCSE